MRRQGVSRVEVEQSIAVTEVGGVSCDTSMEQELTLMKSSTWTIQLYCFCWFRLGLTHAPIFESFVRTDHQVPIYSCILIPFLLFQYKAMVPSQ